MEKYITCRLILIILTLLVTTEVFATGLDNFMKFGAQGGSMTSINKGAVISDQKAGYMTGGSIISRGTKTYGFTTSRCSITECCI